MTDSDIYKTVVDLPTDERSAYLDQACGSNLELRQKIEALLESQTASESFFDKTAPESGTDLDQTVRYETLTEKPGSVIGQYKLLEQIGEGGMGVVYLAEQRGSVHRQVALKVIKPGMDSKLVIARFEAERQALAMMAHSNIAKVLDAGTTPTGRPYFVMEMVEGQSLTKFCDSHKLPLKDRLKLFITICQAVQHAHQKGIVHRDLKPSNILVSMVEGKAIPKVIDFGVAKAVGGKLTDESLHTILGSVVGTLEFMSPEQASLSTIDIDTRSDIYSLGIILYELLTGLRPMSPQRWKALSFTERVQVIEEEDPAKPSERLALASALPVLAATRQMDPNRLVAKVRGDLDWVVMKCLEKQRDRRYETANALARDIQRHLAHEPIEARPPSRGYRFRKFLRRNRAGVLVAALLLFCLLAGIIGTTIGLVRAERAREEAEQARHQVEQARDTLRLALAHQIAERLQSNFQQLEGVGHTIEAALATQDEWDEDELVDLLEPLLRKDKRLFGLGVAFRPFRVPPTEQALSPPLLAASTVALLGTPARMALLPASCILCSTGFCLYVHRDEDGSLQVAYDPSEEDDHRRRDWYNVPLSEGRAFWTPIAGYDESEVDWVGTALIAYVVPIRREGEIVGVLCADISIKDFFGRDQLSSLQRDLNFGNSSYAFVVSNSQQTWNGKCNKDKGIFISHPNVADSRFQYPNGILELDNVGPRFEDLARKMVAGDRQGVGYAVDPWTGNEATFLFVPLRSPGWTVEMTLVVVIDDMS